MPYNPYAGTLPTYKTGTPAGGAPTSGSGTAYGQIPNLPLYTTDTTQTIGTNAYPQLAAILGGAYQGGLDKEMSNITAALAGRVPGDVMNLLTQSGAERGIAMGSPGAPNANAAYLRALGLTSLGQQEQGIKDLSAVIGQVPIQPTQTGTQTTDLGAARAQYAAAPDPALAAQQALRNAQAGIAGGRASVGMPAAAAQTRSAAAGQGVADPAMEAYWASLSRANNQPAYQPSQSYLDSLYANLPGASMNAGSASGLADSFYAGREEDQTWESLFGLDPSMYGVEGAI